MFAKIHISCIYRVCRTYISKHGLEGKEKENLKKICHFIVTNYAPMWFNIRCLPSYIHGPRHVFHQLQLFKCLDPDVQNIVKPYIAR